MRKFLWCCLAAILCTLSCSAKSDPVYRSRIYSTTEFVQMIRSTVSYSYIPYADPTAMLKAVDVAAVGSVVSVEPALIADPMENYGAVLVGLRPIEMWKEDPSRTGDVVYFYFERPTNLEVSPYREGLPIDAEVAFFGFDWTDEVTFAEGDPGGRVYVAAPQGLFVPEGDERLLNVWGDDHWPEIITIDDLRAALGK